MSDDGLVYPTFRTPARQLAGMDGLSEDDVKHHVKSWLEGLGWQVRVAWGQSRGIDILAKKGDEHWIIEAKGGGSSQPMRVNYFLAVLGTILQRIEDPSARHSIALPDMTQFRGLWGRLPRLAKERVALTALFVDPAGSVEIAD
ncbi:MAG TPA: hypothetical protein VM755_22490 [Stellaceae bacterium]|nr:hypothetical protein [Stellaceae bacterium]